MKLRMKVYIAGTRNGERWPEAGGTVDLPEGEALDLLAGDLAELVDDEPVLEVRPAPAPERAVRTPVPPAPPHRPAPMPNPVDKGGRLFGRKIKD